MYTAYYPSPIGVLKVVGSHTVIIEVSFIQNPPPMTPIPYRDMPPVIQEAVLQLDEYFKGERQHFVWKGHLEGTPFERKVWLAVSEVPFGETASYKGIATSIGHPSAVRAVGNANKKNNLVIFIPCHRIVGKNGNLTGYSAGIWRKSWLLNHEKEVLLGVRGRSKTYFY